MKPGHSGGAKLYAVLTMATVKRVIRSSRLLLWRRSRSLMCCAESVFVVAAGFASPVAFCIHHLPM